MRGLLPRRCIYYGQLSGGEHYRKNFERNGINYDRDGRDLPEQVGSDTRLG